MLIVFYFIDFFLSCIKKVLTSKTGFLGAEQRKSGLRLVLFWVKHYAAWQIFAVAVILVCGRYVFFVYHILWYNMNLECVYLTKNLQFGADADIYMAKT